MVAGSTLLDLASAGTELCKLNDTGILARNGVFSSQMWVFCFTSSYIYSLLATGYGFPVNDPRILTVAPSTSTYSYALGAMITFADLQGWTFAPSTASSAASATPDDTHRKDDAIVGLAVAFAIVSVLLFVVVIVAFCCCTWKATSHSTTKKEFSGVAAPAPGVTVDTHATSV